MPYFYCPELNDSSEVTLSKEESLHACKTLRLREGDNISLIDGSGQKATAVITFAPKKKGQLSCQITSIVNTPEPKRRIHLYIAPPRHNILTSLIKQCVELGVWEIHFIDCEFSVAKPKDKKESLQKDIITGAKQSGNSFFPKVNLLKSFKEALQQCTLPVVIGAVPEDKFERFSNSHNDISLWIGPEGGFSAKEKQALKEQNSQSICIGNYILRVETATIGLLSILNSQNS